MPIRVSKAQWTGGLKNGKGKMQLGSGVFEGPYSFGSRFESENGSNPEELIAAAHAGCFSMALSMILEDAGHTPEMIDTQASVHLDPKNGGFKISRIDLETRAQVPGMDKDTFDKCAQTAKVDCPVSHALKGVEISLKAQMN
ncbi:MAG: OsmC family protein [Gammaproteobacteria bacterium]